MASSNVLLEEFAQLNQNLSCDGVEGDHADTERTQLMFQELGKAPHEDGGCPEQEGPSCLVGSFSDFRICCGQEVDDKSWVCAICMDEIQLQDFSQIKGCEHSYCVSCILRWASYKENPWCPQCRMPFSMLFLYRTLEGSMCDYMVEEPVCLLLCASWFKSLPAPDAPNAECDDYPLDYDEYYEEEEEELAYSVRLGNRRWGENGFVRGGRMEARPAHRGGSSSGSSSQSSGRAKAGGGDGNTAGNASGGGKKLGRRAKRSQQREMYDSTAASKAHAGHARGNRR